MALVRYDSAWPASELAFAKLRDAEDEDAAILTFA
jgi:hypothetical protein